MIAVVLMVLASVAATGQSESPAVALEKEVQRLATGNAKTLWPGFDPLAVPLAVYDGERTFLFRHPSPPQEFAPASAGTHVMKGRHEAVTANTSARIGGVPTATVLLDSLQLKRPLVDVAAMAVHEAFHVFQRALHPGWSGNEADLFTYPDDSIDLLALRRLESETLRRALAAGDTADAACLARQALALRGKRYAGMDSVHAAYERGTELNEGLATYVEIRTAGRSTVDLQGAEFWPNEIRRRAYGTGAALALLLDRFLPGWQAKFEANDRQVLDAALAAALGPGKVCSFGDSVMAEARKKAWADVFALHSGRQRRVAAFEQKPGWRVVIEVGKDEPLWPQGFDPLNVERVDDTRVLHTRFVRLGNGAGRVEVLNAEALTEGNGPHPLFQGIRRVVLTGLAEPEVSDADGKQTVRAPGVTLEFKGASVAKSGQTVTVRLGS